MVHASQRDLVSYSDLYLRKEHYLKGTKKKGKVSGNCPPLPMRMFSWCPVASLLGVGDHLQAHIGVG